MPKNIEGACPQKTQIEYPELPRKKYKYHMVDFIPRKKNEEEIMSYINKEKNKPLVSYGKRGVDRAQMIEDLQEINRFGDKKHLEAALAKEREMKLYMKMHGGAQIDNKTRLKNKYNMQIA